MTGLETDFPKLRDWTEEQAINNADRDFFYERKYDGTAAIIDTFPDKPPKIWGRRILKDGNRRDYTSKFPEVVDMVSHINVRSRVLGELVIFDEEGNDKFKLIQQRATREKSIAKYAKNTPARFLAFDMLIFKGTDIRPLTYADRRSSLISFSDSYMSSDSDHFCIIATLSGSQAKRELLEQLKEEGFEGIVAKHWNKPFPEGMYKYKPTVTEEVIWYGDYKPGTGRNEGLVGSLICHQYIGGELREVAKAGGLTDKLRAKFTNLSRSGEVSELCPMILEVEAMEYLPSGKLRSPRFHRIRTDKSPEQCTREL